MNKRGSTHIEMVLTFVFFIAAVGFAFYLFNPFQSERELSSTNYLLRNVIESLESEVDTYNVLISESSLPEGQTAAVIKVDFNRDLEGLNFSITNYSGYPLPFRTSGNLIYFNWEKGLGRLITVRASDAINSIILDPSIDISSAVEYYLLSSWQRSSIVSQDKAASLIERYNADYPGLKQALNISQMNDFSFNITKSNLTSIQERKALKNVKVGSESQLVEFITLDGNITFVEVSVKIW
ncbi:MAG: hypothetical protein Q8Q31_01705 [Nanoarchaeota archaeon]|nr:hypothetical protein [Nanoarchaeota archaeon]